MTKKESDRVEWTLRYLLRFIREKEQQFEAELPGCTTDRETMMVLGGLGYAGFGLLRAVRAVG